uniref:Uncharacterized protein n=1 Tax=Euplotes crassus TaxID=5936 RepID=A0A7S3NUJ0_EUPCR|mmetsp:Transcript_2292/g.2164  ORF Transcript_2292/g.2164 Transcript_2292/m.2164 type:complete len:624 (+) Transcript_2292:13-1884(+)
MFLRSASAKTSGIAKISARAMSLTHKHKVSEEADQALKKLGKFAEDKARRTRVHVNDIGPTILTRKEVDKVFQEFRLTSDTEADRARHLKPGDPKREEFYSRISAIEEGDHEVIQGVKSKIRKLLEEELRFLEFKAELEDPERRKIIDETYGKIYDLMAPGNTHRKIPYVLPHEHIHPQHHIDAESLTEDDIDKLYAYYSLYVDMHISQIRRSADDKSYIPPQFNQISLSESHIFEHKIDNKFLEYYYQWREPTRTWRSQTQEIDHEKEWEALPVNHHPDPKAFTKNEVEWSEDQKFPHVANRLGYPIMGETPIERMLGIERAHAHPSYQFQAFVQTPSMDPDPTLNFEKGETIYENKRVGEWVRMWKWIMTGTLPFWPAFFTFEIYQGDGVPSLQWLADIGSWYQVPTQMQDSGGWGLEGVRYCDEHDYMNIQYIWKRAVLRPAHTLYQLALLYTLRTMNFNYATKLVYNKDKDLVFAYKPHGWFSEKEHIYEVHHLESMVPATVNAYRHLGMGHKDGITTLSCMDTKDTIKLYNDPKYWNIELRDGFVAQTRTMWPGLMDKFHGRVVQVAHIGSEKMDRHIERVHRELDEAVEKHGPVTPSPTYSQQFHDRVRQQRKQIVG